MRLNNGECKNGLISQALVIWAVCVGMLLPVLWMTWKSLRKTKAINLKSVKWWSVSYRRVVTLVCCATLDCAFSVDTETFVARRAVQTVSFSSLSCDRSSSLIIPPRTQLLACASIDLAALTSHDWALLCRSSPRGSWEIQGFQVKVQARWRFTSQLFGWLAQVL